MSKKTMTPQQAIEILNSWCAHYKLDNSHSMSRAGAVLAKMVDDKAKAVAKA